MAVLKCTQVRGQQLKASSCCYILGKYPVALLTVKKINICDSHIDTEHTIVRVQFILMMVSVLCMWIMWITQFFRRRQILL